MSVRQRNSLRAPRTSNEMQEELLREHEFGMRVGSGAILHHQISMRNSEEVVGIGSKEISWNFLPDRNGPVSTVLTAYRAFFNP